MEVPEIRNVADICHVFYNGSIIGTLENDQIDETTVMRYSTNSIGAQQAGEESYEK
jgi:ribose transport system ATP-binding protein